MRTLLLLTLVISAGCSVYDPNLVVDGPGSACGIQPPRRPMPSGEPDLVDEVSYALRDVNLDQGSGWRNIGFDLDGVCTVAPDLDSNCLPPSGREPPEDGDQGRDNVFGQSVFPTVSFAIPGLEAASREFQEAGNGAVMVRLALYNGTPNDDQVVVTIAVTVFGTTAVAAGDVTFAADGTPTVPPAGGFPPPPVWSGDDVFWGRTDNFSGGDQSSPLIFDDNAYVSNGMLVARLPEGSDFIFPGIDSGLKASLTGGLLVGRISSDLSQLQQVTVAGRWRIADLLDTAESVGACAGSENLRTLTNLLNDVADVRSLAGTGGEGVSCDAISAGIVFQGFRAFWGGIAAGDPLANACTP